MNFLDFDLREYLQSVGVDYWEAGSPNISRGWVGIECVYCDDTHNHLGIRLDYKNFTCWLCKAGGSLLTLIQDLENVTYRVAKRRVDEYQSATPMEADVPERLQNVGQSILPFGCGNLYKAHRVYLRKRRFDPERLEAEWGVRSARPIAGKEWAYRIIIPVQLEGRTMTWVGLDHTGSKQTKYKAASLAESFMPTGELVYGADKAGKRVVVVEGIADVWRVGPGAVATFGMGITTARMQLLRNLEAEQYFVMYDAEARAQENAQALAFALGIGGRKVEVIKLAMGDPDDLSDGAVDLLRMDLGLDA